MRYWKQISHNLSFLFHYQIQYCMASALTMDVAILQGKKFARHTPWMAKRKLRRSAEFKQDEMKA